MPDAALSVVSVRPIAPDERARFDLALDEHHWLGHRLVGETMRYVAFGADGEWLAVLGFGAAALACGPRDRFIGWDDDQHFRRLRYVTNNQRFCVLPAGRRHNLASNVLAKTLRRLSSDFEVRWGHPVVIVETFVDPARHQGTCYLAGGFSVLGQTLGYGRASGRYRHHGQVKLVLARALRRDARRLLTSAFDHPTLLRRRSATMLDLSRATLTGDGGLLEALEAVPDHRKRRGVRHQLASILAIATCATLAGSRSLAALSEYADDCPQEVLARLGAKYHPKQKRYIVPHIDTFTRALSNIDTSALDQVVGAWLYAQVKAGLLDAEQVVIALDGKAMRGSLREDGRAVHLFGAMVHGAGIVIGQEEVDEKSNEITALRPLLAPLDIVGALVTADALHTQRDHAKFIVEEKSADYLLQLKNNQPTLFAAAQAIEESSFSKEHRETSRGHGRIEHRYVRVADVPEGFDFPHAAQIVVVYRERADLSDVLTSDETSYYVTSVTKDRGDQVVIGPHVRGHWGIENKVHWVRDWNFDEDRHRHHAEKSPARALATLRNLAISLLRLAGATNIAASLRWVSRDAARAAALIGA